MVFFRESIKILHVYNDYRAKSCSCWKTSIPTGTSSQKYTGNFIPRLGHLQYRELQKYKFIPRDGNLQYCELQKYKCIPRDGHLQYRELHKCTGTFIPRVGHIQYFELKHLSTQLYESVWKPPQYSNLYRTQTGSVQHERLPGFVYTIPDQQVIGSLYLRN